MADVAMLVSAATQASGSESARAARTLDGTDTAHLHLVHQNEMLLYEEGTANGRLPGHMRAELTIGTVFTGRLSGSRL